MSRFNEKELRDEFAIEVMNKMIEASMVGSLKFNDWSYVAEDCYIIADAMMQAREKTEGNKSKP